MSEKKIDNLFFRNDQCIVRNCLVCTMWTWNITDQQHPVRGKRALSFDIWDAYNDVSSDQHFIADDSYEKDE